MDNYTKDTIKEYFSYFKRSLKTPILIFLILININVKVFKIANLNKKDINNDTELEYEIKKYQYLLKCAINGKQL